MAEFPEADKSPEGSLTSRDARFIMGMLDAISAKIDALEGRISAKIDAMEGRISAKIDAMEGRISAKIDAMEGRISAKIDAMEGRINARNAMEGRIKARIDAIEYMNKWCVSMTVSELAVRDADVDIIFTMFLKQSPAHPFSVFVRSNNASDEKKRTLACGALNSSPEDWKPIQDVVEDKVPETLDRFRMLMKSTFVLEKLGTFMSAVGVEFSLGDVPDGVDAFLKAAHRGFCKLWTTSEFFFGATLDLEHVFICDDVEKLYDQRKGGEEAVCRVAGQRLLTLLHEFAHFFPRFVINRHGQDCILSNTPPDKQPRVSIDDIPNADWRKQAGKMFMRLLFGRAFKSRLDQQAADQLLEWDGAAIPSARSNGVTAKATRPVELSVQSKTSSLHPFVGGESEEDNENWCTVCAKHKYFH